MFLLTEDAVLVCRHELGRIAVAASQDLVQIAGRRLLVRPDPEGRPIAGCPNIGATIKPCQRTLAVQDGYSSLVRVEGRPVCLDTLVGLTDGTPPGVVKYAPRSPGQDLVREGP